MTTQRSQQHVRPPEKHTGVPVETAGLDESLGGGEVRLLAEFHDWNRIERPGLHAVGKLDIAVAGIGPARRDSQYGDRAPLRRPERRPRELQIAAGPCDYTGRRGQPPYRILVQPLQKV